MPSIQTLFVANRGEIARRIIRAARRLGIRTAVLYTRPDRRSLFVEEADVAYLAESDPPSAAYLDVAGLIDCALRAGADAVHPGYGFLAESAELSRRVRETGLIFVGPTPEALVALGSKDKARELARSLGVPTAPGYDGDDQSLETLRLHGDRIGFPLLVKAAAGGGGRGMKRVESADALPDALASARREAAAFFGDGRLLLERLVAPARHIEVQLAGDSHGNVRHLYERDCSLQRNYQKLIEEAPARELSDDLRASLCSDAVRIAQAVSLEGLATAEFLVPLDPEAGLPDRIFLEVNPRLQVEHPVTEMITGIDLVELQLRIAGGEAIGFTQSDVTCHGVAIEARICAEVPAERFRPSAGTITDLSLPLESPDLRLEHAIQPGTEVGTAFDSLIVKLITRGDTRESAVARLVHALRSTMIAGLDTNQSLLARLAERTAAAAPDIQYIERLLAASDPERSVPELVLGAGAAIRAALASSGGSFDRRSFFRSSYFGGGDGIEPLDVPPIRLTVSSAGVTPSGPHIFRLQSLRRDETGCPIAFEVSLGETIQWIGLASTDQAGIALNLDGGRFDLRFAATSETDRTEVHWRGRRYLVTLGALSGPSGTTGSSTPTDMEIKAPLPGVVLDVRTEQGHEITEGETVVVLESMKMEHSVRSPLSGRVGAVLVGKGSTVKQGQPLVTLEPAASAAAAESRTVESKERSSKAKRAR